MSNFEEVNQTMLKANALHRKVKRNVNFPPRLHFYINIKSDFVFIGVNFVQVFYNV